MTSKSFCNRLEAQLATKRLCRQRGLAGLAFSLFLILPAAQGADAPQWMHAVANAPLPAHDEKTNAILLYSEDVLSVHSNGKINKVQPPVYKILPPTCHHY